MNQGTIKGNQTCWVFSFWYHELRRSCVVFFKAFKVFFMQLISVASGDVHFMQSVYIYIAWELKIRLISVLQKHIYVCRCKWNHFDKSDSYPI